MCFMERKKMLQKIRTEDGKSLIANFSSLSFLQIASYIFPLITLPYLTKVIGVEYFGKIAFAWSIVVYFQTFVDYGFMFSSVRDISRVRNDIGKVSLIFSVTMYARLFLATISFLIFFLLVQMIPYLYNMKTILLFTFLVVPGHVLFAEWLFQGLEKMKYITLFNLLIKLFFTILVFVVIKEKEDYYLQPLLTAIGYIISGLLSIIVVYRYGIRFVSIPFGEVIVAIRENTDLFINQLFPNLYNSFSTFMLGMIHGNVANGIFDAGYKFSGTCQQFFYIISRTFFPYLSRKAHKHSVYAKWNLIISSSCSFLLFLCAPFIIKFFFSPEFYNGVLVLRILSVSVFFLNVSNVYGTTYLVVNGYEKQLRQATMCGSIISFFVAVPLVYFYSYIGAAIVISFARGIVAFFVYFQYRKLTKI